MNDQANEPANIRHRTSSDCYDSVTTGALSHGNGQWLVQSTRRLHYPVRMVPPLLDGEMTNLIEIIGTHKTLVVTTPTVNRLYASDITKHLNKCGADASLLVLECDETTKDLSQVETICQSALMYDLARNGLLVSIGGGVCSDLVTMAASWIRRGIRHVRIPTTLIGQIDAAIGIKGAVNFRNKKSYLGCFYVPTDVLIDPSMLATLPSKNLRCGMAEILKIGLILDRSLFNQVEIFGNRLIDSQFQATDAARDEILSRSINGMLTQLEPNLFEDQTFERLVDFGHTFSPLLEAATDFELPHGYAVAVDMALSSAIAYEMGLLCKSSLNRILKLLCALELPIYSDLLTLSLCRESLSCASTHRGGSPNLIVPVEIGRGDFIRSEFEVTDTMILRALKHVKAIATTELDSPSAAYA